MAQTVKKQLDEQRPRRRRGRVASRQKVVPVPESKAKEVVAFFLAALGLFLLLSISSHVRGVYTLDGAQPAALARENLMGFIGYRISRFLFRAFGWCSFATVIWAWLLARSVWQGGYKNSFVSYIFSSITSVIMALSAATIASLFYDSEGGGAVGLTISSALLPFLNRGGTILVASFFLVLAFVASTGVQLAELFGIAAFTSRKISTGATKVGSSALRAQLSVTKQVFLKTSAAIKKERERKHELKLLASRAAEEDESKWKIETPLEKDFVFGNGAGSFSNVVALLPPPKHEIIDVEPIEPQEEAEEDLTPRAARGLTLRDRLKRKKKTEVVRKRKQNFALPSLDLLTKVEPAKSSKPKDEELLKNCKHLERALADFKVGGKIVEVQPGPVITLYEFEPAPGVKVQRVIALADDLALALKVASVRVYAPVPGKGTVGIEVPNQTREIVSLRDVLDSDKCSKEDAPLTLALGKDTFGEPFVADLAGMPHLLIAGATGTGKSVCINSVLLSLLYRNSPEELRLILIDPKMLELSVYEQIPHLKAPVVTNPKRARGVLWWAVEEMERRYRVMMDLGVRNLAGYNQKLEEEGPEALRRKIDPEAGEGKDGNEFSGAVLTRLPQIVIVVDELADLMLTVGREIEELLTRLAQKARAAGIHLILATQRPSVNVITGLIKANFPSRISFKVATRIDSRTVLDGSGSERLLGQGDMLFLTSGAGRPRRLHGAFVSDNEVHQVVKWWRSQGNPDYDPQIEEMIKKFNDADKEGGIPGMPDAEFESDPLYDQALQLVVEKGQASTSMIQRVFRIGYNRAARILEMMEREGVVGPADGAKPRQILAPRHGNIV